MSTESKIIPTKSLSTITKSLEPKAKDNKLSLLEKEDSTAHPEQLFGTTSNPRKPSTLTTFDSKERKHHPATISLTDRQLLSFITDNDKNFPLYKIWLEQFPSQKIQALAVTLQKVNQVQHDFESDVMHSENFTLAKLRHFIQRVAQQFFNTSPKSYSTNLETTIAGILNFLKELTTLLGNMKSFQEFIEATSHPLPIGRILVILTHDMVIYKSSSHESDVELEFPPFGVNALLYDWLLCDKETITALELSKAFEALGLLAEINVLSQQKINIKPFLSHMESVLRGEKLEVIQKWLLGLGRLAENQRLTAAIPAEHINIVLDIFAKKNLSDGYLTNTAYWGFLKLLLSRQISSLSLIKTKLIDTIFSNFFKEMDSRRAKDLCFMVDRFAATLNYLPSVNISCVTLFEILIQIEKTTQIQVSTIELVTAKDIGSALKAIGDITRFKWFYSDINVMLLHRVDSLLAHLLVLANLCNFNLSKQKENIQTLSAIINALYGLALLGMTKPTFNSLQLTNIAVEFLPKYRKTLKEYNSLLTKLFLYLCLGRIKKIKQHEPILADLDKIKPSDPGAKTLLAQIGRLFSRVGFHTIPEENEEYHPQDLYCQKGWEIVLEMNGDMHGARKNPEAVAMQDLFKGFALSHLTGRPVFYFEYSKKIPVPKLVVSQISQTFYNYALTDNEDLKKLHAPSDQHLFEYITERTRGREVKWEKGLADSKVAIGTNPFRKPPTSSSVESEPETTHTPLDIEDKHLPRRKAMPIVNRKHAPPLFNQLMTAVSAGDLNIVQTIVSSKEKPLNPFTKQADPYIFTVALMKAMEDEHNSTSPPLKRNFQGIIKFLVDNTSISSLNIERCQISPLILAKKWQHTSPEVFRIISDRWEEQRKTNSKQRRKLKKKNEPREKIDWSEIQAKADQLTFITIDHKNLLRPNSTAASLNQNPSTSEMAKIPIDPPKQSLASNIPTPIEKLQAAAANGNSAAQYQLALHYKKDEDPRRHLFWLQESASKGYKQSQYEYALHLLSGTYGVKKDEAEAYRLLNLAVTEPHGSAQAQLFLGQKCYEHHDKRYHPRALSLFRLAAAKGLPEAHLHIGNCYFFAKGVEKNEKQGFHHYQIAANQEVAEAQSRLGDCYERGTGVLKNLDESVKFYELASKQGNGSASFMLGVHYEYYACPKDVKKANEYYQLSGRQGYKLAEVKTYSVYKLPLEFSDPALILKCLEDHSVYLNWINRQASKDKKIAIQMSLNVMLKEWDVWTKTYSPKKVLPIISVAINSLNSVLKEPSSKKLSLDSAAYYVREVLSKPQALLDKVHASRDQSELPPSPEIALDEILAITSKLAKEQKEKISSKEEKERWDSYAKYGYTIQFSLLFYSLQQFLNANLLSTTTLEKCIAPINLLIETPLLICKAGTITTEWLEKQLPKIDFLPETAVQFLKFFGLLSEKQYLKYPLANESIHLLLNTLTTSESIELLLESLHALKLLIISWTFNPNSVETDTMIEKILCALTKQFYIENDSKNKSKKPFDNKQLLHTVHSIRAICECMNNRFDAPKALPVSALKNILQAIISNKTLQRPQLIEILLSVGEMLRVGGNHQDDIDQLKPMVAQLIRTFELQAKTMKMMQVGDTLYALSLFGYPQDGSIPTTNLTAAFKAFLHPIAYKTSIAEYRKCAYKGAQYWQNEPLPDYILPYIQATKPNMLSPLQLELADELAKQEGLADYKFESNPQIDLDYPHICLTNNDRREKHVFELEEDIKTRGNSRWEKRLRDTRLIHRKNEDGHVITTLTRIVSPSLFPLDKKTAVEKIQMVISSGPPSHRLDDPIRLENQGLAQEQFEEGQRYAKGINGVPDVKKAALFYKLAADKNLPDGQFAIAKCYRDGEGVPEDIQTAFKYFKLAADQEIAEAQLVVADSYLNGKGVSQDNHQAYRYYYSAADQNLPEAQHKLGYCYLHGFNRDAEMLEKHKKFPDLIKDSEKYEREESIIHFRSAASQGYVPAIDELKKMGLWSESTKEPEEKEKKQFSTDLSEEKDRKQEPIAISVDQMLQVVVKNSPIHASSSPQIDKDSTKDSARLETKSNSPK